MLFTLPETHQVRMTYTKNSVDLFAKKEWKKQQLPIDIILCLTMPLLTSG